MRWSPSVPLVLATTVLSVSACRDEAPPAADEAPAEAAAAPQEPAAAAAPLQAAPTAAADEASANPRTWSATSHDGKATLRHEGLPEEKCRAACSVEGKEVWTAERCLGERVDHRFVSADCERVVVIHPVARGNLKEWRDAQVAHVYKRGGAVDYVVNAGGVIRRDGVVRQAGAEVDWLRGTLRNPGSPPRYTADGEAVEFDTLEGRTERIPLRATRSPRSR